MDRPRVAVAIIAALSEELRDLRLRREGGGTLSGTSASVAYGRLGDVPVVTVVTGIGREPATTVTRRLLQEWAPQAVLSIGFCGGLRREPRVGHLVLSPRLVIPPADGGAHLPVEADDALVGATAEALQSRGLSLHLGDCVTVRRPAVTEKQKAALGAALGAVAVDMESYWVCREAQEAGVPWLTLRSVIDPVERPLPPFLSKHAGRGARRWLLPVLGYVCSSPGGALELARLRLAMRTARATLARGVWAAVPALAGASVPS